MDSFSQRIDDDEELEVNGFAVVEKSRDMDVEVDFARSAEDTLAATSSLVDQPARRAPLYEAPEFVRRLNVFEEVDPGGVVTFECQYIAFPKPTTKWYKDDDEVLDTDRVHLDHSGEKEGILRLVIRDAVKEDEGAYKCKSENQEGVAATTGYLSVAGNSPSQTPRPPSAGSDRSATNPPLLRAITEQQSMEEREAAAYQTMVEDEDDEEATAALLDQYLATEDSSPLNVYTMQQYLGDTASQVPAQALEQYLKNDTLERQEKYLEQKVDDVQNWKLQHEPLLDIINVNDGQPALAPVSSGSDTSVESLEKDRIKAADFIITQSEPAWDVHVYTQGSDISEGAEFGTRALLDMEEPGPPYTEKESLIDMSNIGTDDTMDQSVGVKVQSSPFLDEFQMTPEVASMVSSEFEPAGVLGRPTTEITGAQGDGLMTSELPSVLQSENPPSGDVTSGKPTELEAAPSSKADQVEFEEAGISFTKESKDDVIRLDTDVSHTANELPQQLPAPFEIIEQISPAKKYEVIGEEFGLFPSSTVDELSTAGDVEISELQQQTREEDKNLPTVSPSISLDDIKPEVVETPPSGNQEEISTGKPTPVSIVAEPGVRLGSKLEEAKMAAKADVDMEWMKSWFQWPWVFYLLLSGSATLLAAGLELCPAVVVLIVAIASFASFLLLPQVADCA